MKGILSNKAAGNANRTIRKPRLPVICGGLALCLAAYAYSLETTSGLLVLAFTATVAASLWRRYLPATLRAMSWGFLLMILLGITANVEQLIPDPENIIGGLAAYVLDRLATFTFAVGLTALFFRPSPDSMTLIGTSILPLLIVTVDQAEDSSGGGTALWLTFLSLLLVLFAVQSERARVPGARRGLPRHGKRAWLARILFLAIWVIAGTSLTTPIDAAANSLRNWLYQLAGMELPDRSRAWRRGGMLSVAPPPGNWQRRTGIVLEIEAGYKPEYLREEVFFVYGRRQWVGRSKNTRTPYRLNEWQYAAEADWAAYRLAPGNEKLTGDVWRFRPLGSRSLASFCLPGAARAFALSDDYPPVASPDGIVTLRSEAHPPRYQALLAAAPDVEADSSAVPAGAFPWPDPTGMREYLAIPPRLAHSVSNWVKGCYGTNYTAEPMQTVSRLVSYFHENFSYRQETAYGRVARSDPLVEFMRVGEGHCTLFASAAVLMLREKGIPARVVAGYYCSERHPYTGKWVVRERDGHAWCEAWDEKNGQWILVEATPASGLPDGYRAPSRIRLMGEGLMAGWRWLVDKLRFAELLLLMATRLAGLFEWLWQFVQTASGGALVFLLTILGALRWWLKRSVMPQNEEQRLRRKLIARMGRLERRLVPAQLRRQPHEAWGTWLQRVEVHLPPERVEILQEVLEEYQTLRYQPAINKQAAGEWLHRNR